MQVNIGLYLSLSLRDRMPYLYDYFTTRKNVFQEMISCDGEEWLDTHSVDESMCRNNRHLRQTLLQTVTNCDVMYYAYSSPNTILGMMTVNYGIDPKLNKVVPQIRVLCVNEYTHHIGSILIRIIQGCSICLYLLSGIEERKSLEKQIPMVNPYFSDRLFLSAVPDAIPFYEKHEFTIIGMKSSGEAWMDCFTSKLIGRLSSEINHFIYNRPFSYTVPYPKHLQDLLDIGVKGKKSRNRKNKNSKHKSRNNRYVK